MHAYHRDISKLMRLLLLTDLKGTMNAEYLVAEIGYYSSEILGFMYSLVLQCMYRTSSLVVRIDRKSTRLNSSHVD